MDKAKQHYFIFKTVAGFCGLAWGDAGISRFQLPAPTEAETRSLLLRKIPNAEPALPTPDVSASVSAIDRYFRDEKTNFSEIALDLHEQSEFSKRIYAAARRRLWDLPTNCRKILPTRRT